MDVLEPSDLKELDYVTIWDTMIENIYSNKMDLSKIVSQSIARLSSMSHIVFKNETYKKKIMTGILDLCRIENSEVVANAL